MSGAILVTGATGFVGRQLLTKLEPGGQTVIALTRRWMPDLPPGIIQRIAGPIETLDLDGWLTVLEGVETVIHLAAIAHTGPGGSANAYEAVNHRAVAALAEAAARLGTLRIVFLSSIRAQAGASATDLLSEASAARPDDDYGRAKLRAEQALAEYRVAHVTLRPTLIIGSPPKANLAMLLKLAATGLPLPFASLKSRRSAVSLEDVTALIIRAIDDPAMTGKTFILADPDAMTLAEMIVALRSGLGMAPRLLPFPPAVLRLPFWLAGRDDIFERLGGPLVAKPEALLKLGWSPRKPVALALQELAAKHHFVAQKLE